MKIKISWPAGIILSLISFVLFILYFVYKVTFVPEYDHHLVSEDYYKDELNYQQEINKLNNAAELSQNITYKKVSDGLLISFPNEFNPSEIKGTINFQRGSNTKIDFNLPIELETHDYLIENSRLIEGRWDIKINWVVNGKAYLFKEKIMF
jgi:hypothetical protein